MEEPNWLRRPALINEADNTLYQEEVRAAIVRDYGKGPDFLNKWLVTHIEEPSPPTGKVVTALVRRKYPLRLTKTPHLVLKNGALYVTLTPTLVALSAPCGKLPTVTRE